MATVEQIAEVNEIGETIAESVNEFLHTDYGAATIDDLAAQGIVMEAIQSSSKIDDSLAGLTFVVTGTLSKFTRSEVQQMIKDHGGKVSSSVSKNTSYLLAGEEAGSKLAKAQKLNVRVIDESAFSELLNDPVARRAQSEALEQDDPGS